MSQDNHANLSRRTLLKGMAAAAGTSMLPAMLSASRAHAGNGKPETTKAKLGFIALTDAAPLFVALEKGLFAKHGMPEVEGAEAIVLGHHPRQPGTGLLPVAVLMAAIFLPPCPT